MLRSRLTSERGSILIQVAVGLIALMAFSAFVFDWGVMWVSRRQAQNAADSGALAGAVALAFDPGAIDNGVLGAGTKAKQSAIALAQSNRVWGALPSAGANNLDSTYPVLCPDGTTACLRVDVYRNVARGNPLPMFFGQLVGLTQQGVQATAMAQAAVADASDCLKPWAIPDRWIDRHDETPTIDMNTWTVDDEFDTVVAQGPGKGDPLPDADTYVRPGYTLAADYGRLITLKVGNPQATIGPGNFFPVALPTGSGPSRGGSDYRYNIEECNGTPVSIGASIPTEPGNMVGPTRQGMDALIAKDPGATWAYNPTTDSWGVSTTFPGGKSPRVVAVPVFDPASFTANGRTNITVVNILGFFLENLQANGDVVGYFCTMPGLKAGTGPSSVDPSAAFLKVPLLVR